MTTFLKAIKNQLKDDYKVAKRKPRLGWRAGLSIGGGTIFLIAVCAYFHAIDKAGIAVASAEAFGFVLWMKWSLRQQRWFWVTLGVLAIIHLGVAFHVSIDFDRALGRALAGLGLLDAIAMLIILTVAGRLWNGSTPLEEERARASRDRKLAKTNAPPSVQR